jgi:hypothetical protein
MRRIREIRGGKAIGAAHGCTVLKAGARPQ